MGLLSPLTQSTDSVFTVRRLDTILRGLRAVNRLYQSSLLLKLCDVQRYKTLSDISTIIFCLRIVNLKK